MLPILKMLWYSRFFCLKLVLNYFFYSELYLQVVGDGKIFVFSGMFEVSVFFLNLKLVLNHFFFQFQIKQFTGSRE